MRIPHKSGPGGEPGCLRPDWIRSQFDRLAPHYDELNSLLSLGLQHLWRHRLLAGAHPPAQAVVLDLCAGTGELARLWLRRFPSTNRLILADFSLPMLSVAQRRLPQAALACFPDLPRSVVRL